MNRRAFIATATAILFAPLAAEAQQAVKVPRIGYLWSGSAGSDPVEIGGLRQGLREFGYVENQNLVIEYRYAEDRVDRLPKLIAELTNLNLAVLVTAGTPVTAAAKRGAGTTPVVSVSGDPVGSGLVQSLARPGGTITGLSFAQGGNFSGKWLELIREVAPKATGVGVIWNVANRASEADVKEMEVLATRLGLRLSSHAVRHPADIDAAFAAVTRARVGALIIASDPLVSAVTQRTQIVRLAAANRIPTIYGLREFVDSGGLMSYGPNLFALWRRAAYFVDKILKGAKAGDLPIEQPTTFELVINVKTAKALGLTIPPSLLQRADLVIE